MIWSSIRNRRTEAASDRVTVSHHEWVELKGRADALRASQAIITFAVDGTILDANERFLDVMGYRLDEIKGQHHRIFADPQFARTPAYAALWTELQAGRFVADQFRRLGKGGREIWLQASYNPIRDENGRLYQVVKYATDITAQKLQLANFEGQLAAISKSQAVIEFALDGTVLTANANFLEAMGYRLDEIAGKHHRTFVARDEAASPAYDAFWRSLRAGQFAAGEFRRIGKGGQDVWIQATYNPIMDPNGQPFKIVKYATDISTRKRAERELQALSKRIDSAAQGVHAIASSMAERSRETSGQAGTVREAAEQIAHNVQTVASGSEEMTASIREISQSASEAARVAERAVETASQADCTIGKLGVSSSEIGEVVRTITAIAEQTNLLALNATIEAARAGASGKGFAVVANEVKELAKATATATQDIGNRIAAIQADSHSAVLAIREVSGIVSRIRDIQTSIAGAVEEQTAVTNEMSRNVAAAALGSNEITRSIAAVAATAADTVNGADESMAAAADMLGIASSLHGTSMQLA